VRHVVAPSPPRRCRQKALGRISQVQDTNSMEAKSFGAYRMLCIHGLFEVSIYA
jgi:hypothetical protein